jgi:hypothetical protein
MIGPLLEDEPPEGEPPPELQAASAPVIMPPIVSTSALFLTILRK